MEKFLKPIRQNKIMFIIVTVTLFVFFIGLDLAGGLVKENFHPSYFFDIAFGYIDLEGNSIVHILPLLDIERPYSFWEKQPSLSYQLIFPRHLGSRSAISIEFDYHSFLFGLFYLINTILVSLIISYLLTLIYAKLKREHSKT